MKRFQLSLRNDNKEGQLFGNYTYLLRIFIKVHDYHLFRSKLSHSAVSSLYKVLFRRSLANSCWTVDSRKRDILVLSIVDASASTNISHAIDKSAAPITHAIAKATARYKAPRMASTSLCKKIIVLNENITLKHKNGIKYIDCCISWSKQYYILWTVY